MILNNLVLVPGCAMYCHYRQTVGDDLPNVTKKGGGLAAYVKDGIHIDNAIYALLNLSNEHIELQCLMVRPPSQKKFVLINIYRTPSDNVQIVFDSLVEHLDQLLNFV